MIGGTANIINSVGGKFSIWEGDITGTTLELDSKHHKIKQSWRYNYKDWPISKPSILTIQIVSDRRGGSRLRLRHTGVPEKYKEEIKQGWKEYYWTPMKAYFSNKK